MFKAPSLSNPSASSSVNNNNNNKKQHKQEEEEEEEDITTQNETPAQRAERVLRMCDMIEESSRKHRHKYQGQRRKRRERRLSTSSLKDHLEKDSSRQGGSIVGGDYDYDDCDDDDATTSTAPASIYSGATTGTTLSFASSTIVIGKKDTDNMTMKAEESSSDEDRYEDTNEEEQQEQDKEASHDEGEEDEEEDASTAASSTAAIMDQDDDSVHRDKIGHEKLHDNEEETTSSPYASSLTKKAPTASATEKSLPSHLSSSSPPQARPPSSPASSPSPSDLKSQLEDCRTALLAMRENANVKYRRLELEYNTLKSTNANLQTSLKEMKIQLVGVTKERDELQKEFHNLLSSRQDSVQKLQLEKDHLEKKVMRMERRLQSHACSSCDANNKTKKEEGGDGAHHAAADTITTPPSFNNDTVSPPITPTSLNGNKTIHSRIRDAAVQLLSEEITIPVGPYSPVGENKEKQSLTSAWQTGIMKSDSERLHVGGTFHSKGIDDMNDNDESQTKDVEETGQGETNNEELKKQSGDKEKTVGSVEGNESKVTDDSRSIPRDEKTNKQDNKNATAETKCPKKKKNKISLDSFFARHNDPQDNNDEIDVQSTNTSSRHRRNHNGGGGSGGGGGGRHRRKGSGNSVATAPATIFRKEEEQNMAPRGNGDYNWTQRRHLLSTPSFLPHFSESFRSLVSAMEGEKVDERDAFASHVASQQQPHRQHQLSSGRAQCHHRDHQFYKSSRMLGVHPTAGGVGNTRVNEDDDDENHIETNTHPRRRPPPERGLDRRAQLASLRSISARVRSNIADETVSSLDGGMLRDQEYRHRTTSRRRDHSNVVSPSSSSPSKVYWIDTRREGKHEEEHEEKTSSTKSPKFVIVDTDDDDNDDLKGKQYAITGVDRSSASAILSVSQSPSLIARQRSLKFPLDNVSERIEQLPWTGDGTATERVAPPSPLPRNDDDGSGSRRSLTLVQEEIKAWGGGRKGTNSTDDDEDEVDTVTMKNAFLPSSVASMVML